MLPFIMSLALLMQIPAPNADANGPSFSAVAVKAFQANNLTTAAVITATPSATTGFTDYKIQFPTGWSCALMLGYTGPATGMFCSTYPGTTVIQTLPLLQFVKPGDSCTAFVYGTTPAYAVIECANV